MATPKTICICGSMAFIDEIESLAAVLRQAQYEVATPIREESSICWNSLSESEAFALKRNYIDEHLNKIKQSQLVLVANYEKHSVKGYIGPNTLMEAAFAYALGIKVAYLNLPGEQPCRLEALSISQVVVGEDLPAIQTLIN